MPTIFISHSSSDEKAAGEVKAALAAMGFEYTYLDHAFLDKASGADVEKRLHTEIPRCDALVLVLTDNWLASQWCFTELAVWQLSDKPTVGVTFDAQAKSHALPRLQGVRWVDWQDNGPGALRWALRPLESSQPPNFSQQRLPNRPSSTPFLFVAHVAEDRTAALEIVTELERRGVACWIAPRDVPAGRPYDDEIVDAIEGSRAMLLIFSERCNDSDYIRREVTVAGESHKLIIPFRIEDAKPRRGLRVRLSDLHWIDGFMERERAIDEVMRGVNL